MKKRNIGLCAVALFCMHNNAKAMEPSLKQDNTTVVNHAQIAAAYKTNRPAVKNRLYTSKAPYIIVCWMVNPIHLSIPATSMPCGYVIPVHKSGHTCNWHIKTLN